MFFGEFEILGLSSEEFLESRFGDDLSRRVNVRVFLCPREAFLCEADVLGRKDGIGARVLYEVTADDLWILADVNAFLAAGNEL